ncbi:hypothetical protein ACH5RR_013523, partial [Cinchona calisaya]
NTQAVVVSTEIMTQNWYSGNKKSMLGPKCLFREQDDTGKTGFSLFKDLMAIAGNTLKTNITKLGPLVLPISEQILFFATLLARKLFKNDKIMPYIPDFKLAFEHFCIHAGGRGVIDGIEKNIRLSEIHVEVSRMTLHRFGNTSSSSIWYSLASIEAEGRIKKAHRIWQIGFGSGFECNSAAWVALKNVKPSPNSPWEDCIDSCDNFGRPQHLFFADMVNIAMAEWFEFQNINDRKQGDSTEETGLHNSSAVEEMMRQDCIIINIVGKMDNRKNRIGMGIACSNVEGELLCT